MEFKNGKNCILSSWKDLNRLNKLNLRLDWFDLGYLYTFWELGKFSVYYAFYGTKYAIRHKTSIHFSSFTNSAHKF